MVFATTSFHLFGITPSICTPSLIRNLRTAFAHPTRRKNLSLHLFGQGVLFWTPICRDFWKIFFALHLFAMGTLFWTPKMPKNIYPSTNSHWESPNAHPFWEKIFNPLTYLQWERVFFKSVCKISFHLFPQSDRKLSGVLKKYFCLSLIRTEKCESFTLNWKIPLTNSHWDTPTHKGVLKNRHKKRRLSFDKRQRSDWIQKMIIVKNWFIWKMFSNNDWTSYFVKW